MNSLQRKPATKSEINQFLRDFCDEYRRKLERAYQICADDDGGGSFVIPKLVLIEVAKSFALPPSMDAQVRDVRRQIETQL